MQELYGADAERGRRTVWLDAAKSALPGYGDMRGFGLLQEIVEMVRVHGLGLVIFDCDYRRHSFGTSKGRPAYG